MPSSSKVQRRRFLIAAGATALTGLGLAGGRTLRLHDPDRRIPDLTDAHLAGLERTARATTDKKVLLIGNSAIIRSDFLGHLSRVWAANSTQTQFFRAAANGGRLIGSYRISALRELVRSHEWDALILQDFSATALSRSDRIGSLMAISGFARLVRETPVILFPHWPSAPGHAVYRGGLSRWYDVPEHPSDYAARSQKHYATAARLNKCVLAPVLDAWIESLEAGEALYAGDLHHSNQTGAKLAARVIAETLEQVLSV